MKTPPAKATAAQLPALKSDQELGSWILVGRIDGGGNGEVWRAINRKSGDQVAIKVLTKIKEVAIKRFRYEVQTLKDCADIECVIPVLDSYLPADPMTERSWYVMPLGVPVRQALLRAQLDKIIKAIRDIAGAMIEMHRRNIVHRDVKPANFVMIDGRGYLGDFGLVDIPDKEDITGKKEDLGPRWTMAPEVRRHGSATDGKPADVYSLAKSLWILATSEHQGFEGMYNPYGSTGLRKYRSEGEFVGPLDPLLLASTEHKPESRPTMADFAGGLDRWLSIDGAFHERNKMEWDELLARLFPIGKPVRATWVSLDEIATVLSLIGERSNVNHMFFPTGGGMDLEMAYASVLEPGCIEMKAGGVDLVRPKNLTFEYFANMVEISYFRLELEWLSPVENDRAGANYEELLRLGDTGEYVSRAYYDAGEMNGVPIPSGSIVVSRYFKGSFVIFGKRSPYNMLGGKLDGYNAIHNDMSAEEFRVHVQRIAEAKKRIDANHV